MAWVVVRMLQINISGDSERFKESYKHQRKTEMPGARRKKKYSPRRYKMR